jgi:hypothetical protein
LTDKQWKLDSWSAQEAGVVMSCMVRFPMKGSVGIIDICDH